MKVELLISQNNADEKQTGGAFRLRGEIRDWETGELLTSSTLIYCAQVILERGWEVVYVEKH